MEAADTVLEKDFPASEADSPELFLPPDEGIVTEEEQLEFLNRNSVANLSSPWEYDVNQRSCLGCSSMFTPMNRRHHCRLCGKIFCHRCTKQRSLIPPSSIVLAPKHGKKASPEPTTPSFSPDDDPDRMITYVQDQELLYGKGLEERFKLAREPLRVCKPCHSTLMTVQEELRASNSNAMRFNHIDPTNIRRLFNSPLAFTMGHEIRKAAYTLNNLLPLPKRMGATIQNSRTEDGEFLYSGNHTVNRELENCKENCSTASSNMSSMDGVRIPARLLEQAKGVAVLTVFKGGLGFAGCEAGTGLVVARLGDRWSAPFAIGTLGIAWGALVGAQLSDHVFLLMTDEAVEVMFSSDGSIQLGADIGVAVGPVGRALEADFGATAGKGAPIYTYSMSKGLYAGVSLAGKLIVTRPKVMEKFYGRNVTDAEILSGSIPTPPAAQPLYEALARCHVYASGMSSVPLRHPIQQYDNDQPPMTPAGTSSMAPPMTPPMAPPMEQAFPAMSPAMEQALPQPTMATIPSGTPAMSPAMEQTSPPRLAPLMPAPLENPIASPTIASLPTPKEPQITVRADDVVPPLSTRVSPPVNPITMPPPPDDGHSFGGLSEITYE